MSEITVVLVDDQELVRAGLAMVVGAQADMRVVGQASDGQSAFASVSYTHLLHR